MKRKVFTIASLLAVVLVTAVLADSEVTATDQISIEQATLVDAAALEAEVEFYSPDNQFTKAGQSQFRTAFAADIDYQVIDIIPRLYYYADAGAGYRAYMPRSDLYVDAYLG